MKISQLKLRCEKFDDNDDDDDDDDNNNNSNNNNNNNKYSLRHKESNSWSISIRMDRARPTGKLLDWRAMGTRLVGRPRQRWQEDVMEDLQKLY